MKCNKYINKLDIQNTCYMQCTSSTYKIVVSIRRVFSMQQPVQPSIIRRLG